MDYEKTEDPNVIKKIETVKSEIHLVKLEADIKNLQKQIKNYPNPKEKPDQETLDFWNDMMVSSSDKEKLEEELKKKEELLKQLKRL